MGAVLAAPESPASFSAANVYRDAAPSVVVIFGFDGTGKGSTGTGSVITGGGKILTNDHVITNPKTKRPYRHIQVYLRPPRLTGIERKDLVNPLGARIVARDSSLDLALLQLENPPHDLIAIPIGDSETMRIGQSVAAIGHPGGGGLWTLTTGTISSSRRDHAREIFQTDAAINPGNSGGPLLDEHARMIGINTFVRRVNKQGLPLDGLNYSLRSSFALAWLGRNGVALSITPGAEAVAGPGAADGVAPGAPSLAEPAGLSPRVPPPEEEAPGQEEEAHPEQTWWDDEREGDEEPDADPAPPAGESLRDFEGEHGEQMYGLENRNYRPDRALKRVYQMTLEHAREAFDALDGESLEEF
jgi:S1-C subfamily serine protease